MRRPPIAASIAATLALTASSAAQQVFRSGVEGVVVSVWVRDGNRPVAGLSVRDFQLRDNGVYQIVRDMSIETLPIDLTLTLDLSGSITPAQLERIQRAEEQVVSALHPGDRCRIMTFTDRTVERAPMAAATPVLPPLKAGGSTALYDSAAQTLVAVPDPERRRFAIVMTDGGENSSVIDEPTLLEAAKNSDVVMTFVVPLPGLMVVPPGTNWNFLERLTATTGGRTLVLQRRELGAAFIDALEDFRVSYMLRYVPDGVKRDGWHDIRVDVVQPRDTNPYTVRARKGYYARPLSHD